MGVTFGMRKAAIEKANSRLRLVDKAIRELQTTSDFEGFRDVWSQFLTAAKGIYTVLEQGAKASPQSQTWFASKTAERKGDELLKYVFHARNDDEHGLGAIAEEQPGSLGIGKNKAGFSNAIRINGEIGPGKVLNVTSMDGKPILVEHRPRRPMLLPVRDRGVIYPLPKVHLGDEVDGAAPVPVAMCMAAYLQAMVAEASSLNLAD